MAKYEIKLSLYRTVEADNVDDAADMADHELGRLNNGLLGDLGWTEVVTEVKRKKEAN